MGHGASSDIEVERKTILTSFAEKLAEMFPGARGRELDLLLTEAHIVRLERLQQVTGAPSIPEVVRQALFVFETLVEKQRERSVFKELTSRGELRPLELGIDVVPQHSFGERRIGS